MFKNILPGRKTTGGPPAPEIQPGAAGTPLALRVFLFLAVLGLTIILGLFAILVLTGTLTAGLAESKKIIESELARAANDIGEEYGRISLQVLELAQILSLNIEARAAILGISPVELEQHPAILEEIVTAEYEQVLFALQKARSSGVFFILDATVNPALASAAHSRAGLYLKNMAPNVISASPPNITILRGFPGIGRKKSLALHAQWRMEFDVEQAPYYRLPMEAAGLTPRPPRSRLYYWSEALKLPGTSEEVMLCAAPLIDSRGNVFGVCGLEISAMLFKLKHMPNNNIYRRLFCVLVPVTEETIELEQCLFAGGYSAKMISRKYGTLQVSEPGRHFYSYRTDGDITFLGLHQAVELYPGDSPFADQQWVVAVMVPEEDIMDSVTRLNVILFSSVTLLVIIGIISSFALSQKLLIKPISRGLAMIKAAGPGKAPRTKIPEIDNLADYLARHNRNLAARARRENLSFATLDAFLERARELTPAERAVFKLYGKGYTAQEIAEKLYLSKNTIKTHTKRIYMKLEVGSREELLLYITMLKEAGLEID